MINANFVILGAVLNFPGSASYAIDTLKGKVKPNRVTWFLWSLAPLLAFVAEVSQGVGVTAILTFSAGFNPLIIFIASFINKQSEWKLSKFDIICGTFSILGLILWIITRVGNIAIVLSIMADCLAALPTVIKSYHHPETENWKPYTVGTASALITLLSIREWKFANYAFPLYIFFITALIACIIKFKVGERVKLSGNLRWVWVRKSGIKSEA